MDPESYLGSWVTLEIAGAANSFLSSNVQRFQSDEYDRLFAELQNTVDMERRNQITIALNDLLVGSYSIIPLIHRGSVSAHSNDIEGVWMNAWDSELWNSKPGSVPTSPLSTKGHEGQKDIHEGARRDTKKNQKKGVHS